MELPLYDIPFISVISEIELVSLGWDNDRRLVAFGIRCVTKQ